jgi:NAD-dependent SIR2 family protein deacetylase
MTTQVRKVGKETRIFGMATDVETQVCPNCSRAYSLEKEDGKPERAPDDCPGCGSPMDVELAHIFTDEMAASGYDPAVHALGLRMRGQAEDAEAVMRRAESVVSDPGE